MMVWLMKGAKKKIKKKIKLQREKRYKTEILLYNKYKRLNTN